MQQDKRPFIVHVIHHLVMGGMENGLVNLINRLPESRFRHAIVCIENDSEFRQRIARDDVQIIPLHRSQIGVWKLRVELFRLFRKLRPAIVHTRNLSGLDALPPAWLAGIRCRIHGEHGRDVDDLRGDNRKLAGLRALHRPFVTHYITVSKDLERYLINRVGVAAERITQIYNGVDTERFAPDTRKPTDVLPPEFLGENKIVIGALGRIQPVKDQATLLKAFAELRKTVPELAGNAYLALVGDGPLLAELRQLAQTLGIAEQVWMPGARNDTPAVYRSLDIFVQPSLAEGISNTVLEAMASRLPVVATAVGGNVELVEDGVTGRWFRPGDVDSLVKILAGYLADPGLRAAHADAARKTAVERFSLAAMATKYQEVYESLLPT
ncbi:MAG: TIGR03088 family PEP-CTERM/XrtA system glycosyltransferase [Candidatus Competibacteraceae bacterium]